MHQVYSASIRTLACACLTRLATVAWVTSVDLGPESASVMPSIVDARTSSCGRARVEEPMKAILAPSTDL